MKQMSKTALAQAAKANVNNAKLQAKRLNAALAELGVKIPHGQSLELIAKAMGARTWHAHQAELEKAAQPQQAQAWSPVDGPMTFEQYRQRPCTCIVCGYDMVEGEEVVIDEGEANQRVGCPECGSEWEDVYHLASYRNLHIGDEAPVSDPELKKISDWLVKALPDHWEECLDGLVVDAFRQAASGQPGSAAGAEERLRQAEAAAVAKSQDGLHAQLRYLKESYPGMKDFTRFLANALGISQDNLKL